MTGTHLKATTWTMLTLALVLFAVYVEYGALVCLVMASVLVFLAVVLWPSG